MSRRWRPRRMLTDEPRGDGGFGYDPAFVPSDLDDGRTMAELDPAEKDAISHRGRAARALARKLQDLREDDREATGRRVWRRRLR